MNIMFPWKPIDDDAKDGSEVLLGAPDTPEMEFYRWNAEMAENPNPFNIPPCADPEMVGWLDRSYDPPYHRFTHYLRIEPPEA